MFSDNGTQIDDDWLCARLDQRPGHGAAEGCAEEGGCDKIFEDQASGAKADRPGLAEALRYVRKGDVLMVWKLDRLGRSMRHLIETVTELEAKGVGFRSLTENIDTTTPGGRLVFHLFGALAQFERDLIRERVTAGMQAARDRGRVGGRRPVMTPEKFDRAVKLLAQGLNVREAAARIKVGHSSLYQALKGQTGAKQWAKQQLAARRAAEVGSARCRGDERKMNLPAQGCHGEFPE